MTKKSEPLLSAAISKIAGTTTQSINQTHQDVVQAFNDYGFTVVAKDTKANHMNLITLKYKLLDTHQEHHQVAIHINPRDGFITAKIESERIP